MTITATTLYIPVVTLDAKSDLTYKKLMAPSKFIRQFKWHRQEVIVRLNKKSRKFDEIVDP